MRLFQTFKLNLEHLARDKFNSQKLNTEAYQKLVGALKAKDYIVLEDMSKMGGIPHTLMIGKDFDGENRPLHKDDFYTAAEKAGLVFEATSAAGHDAKYKGTSFFSSGPCFWEAKQINHHIYK